MFPPNVEPTYTPNLHLELFSPLGVGWREDATAGALLDENMLLIDAAVASGGFPKNIVTVSSNYSANPGDFVECDTSSAGFTVTLPLSVLNAKATIVIKKVSSDTNTLTIACSGSDSLDGNASSSVTIPETAVGSVADGITSWRIY